MNIQDSEKYYSLTLNFDLKGKNLSLQLYEFPHIHTVRWLHIQDSQSQYTQWVTEGVSKV